LAAYRLTTPYERPPLRRRAGGLLAAAAVNTALLLVLLQLGIIPSPIERTPSGALVIDFQPEAHQVKQQQRSKAPARTQAKAPARPVAARPRPVPPITSPIPSPHPLPWIEMSHDELAAADLSALPKASDGAGSAGDSEEVGRGPHGEVLYAAEWAREPTNAELGGYLPAGAPEGYGMIACKTIPGDRVDDCIELGNDPPGSHLARAVRQAAWQFRVRPPRRGGRPMIGEWVRIRIDYIHGGNG
jgi:protein TonB